MSIAFAAIITIILEVKQKVDSPPYRPLRPARRWPSWLLLLLLHLHPRHSHHWKEFTVKIGSNPGDR